MIITVIVPTYRRPQDLARCLEALRQQTRPADEVLLVVRDTDETTWDFLAQFDSQPLSLHVLTVTVPGVVAAMNTALAVTWGDVVCFTDDDAAPRPDWLARMEAHFLRDEKIGGVGGRDWVHDGDRVIDGSRSIVGRLQWFGRLIGNHHLGTGEVREVDVLKGVNMSYRKAAIGHLRFDERLKGTGAQAHFEIAFCLALKQQGWKLIYDPQVAVDHYPAQRFDEDQRCKFNDVALSNAVHNETLVLLEHLLPARRIIFLLWALLIGTRESLGLLQWLRFLPSEGILAGKKWLASLRGRWEGWRTWQQAR